jgi:SdrD B-like domain
MRLTHRATLLGRWITWLAIVLALLIGVTAASAAPLSQQGSSQICVLAFEDKNGNGARDNNEPLLGAVGFTLADANGLKGSYTSDGSSEPYCFGKLEAGSYTVRAKAPANFESTTEGQWAISLASGAQYDARYGAKRTGGDPSSSGNTPGSSASTSSGSGTSTLGRIVLGGLGVIILLAAGFMAGTIVQRARNR